MSDLFRTYLPFLKATFKSEYFAYRTRFFLWAIANSVTFLAQLYLWRAIYGNSFNSIINGYSFEEMTCFVCISKLIECVSYASIEDNVAEGIRKGSIANSLIKPVSFRIELLFRAGGKVAGACFIFVPIYSILAALFLYGNNITIGIDIGRLLMGIVFAMTAFFLNYFLSLIFSCVIFRTIKHTGIYMLKKTLFSFLSGALFPIGFYPLQLRNIIKCLPFVYLRYYPVVVIQGKIETKECIAKLLIAYLWVVVLGVLSSVLWRRSVRRLMVFGG